MSTVPATIPAYNANDEASRIAYEAYIESLNEWQPCKLNNNYEIFTSYPYPIRNRLTHKIISEGMNNKGYLQVTIGRCYTKHDVIANQWLPNPNNLNEVDHINTIRGDNHLSNLRYVTHSENHLNRATYKGKAYKYVDKLPDHTYSYEEYAGHKLKNVFLDVFNDEVYLFNGIRYRKLEPRLLKFKRNNKIIYYYNVIDVDGLNVKMLHKILFSYEYGE